MESKQPLVEALKRVVYHGEPVMTTPQLATWYECKIEHIRDNFRKNKDRFIEGKHYFRLEGEEAKIVMGGYTEIFRVSPQYQIHSLYLWTRRGAARHAKMLSTEKAWEVFEMLEDYYFDRPADKQENSSAAPFAELMRDRLELDRNRLELDREHLELDRGRLELDRERLELDREKFRLENSEEAKTRAKVQLLRELASASGDNDYLRYDLVKYSANLIADRKF